MKKNTRLIRTQPIRSDYNEHASPIYLTSSFVFEDAESIAASFNGESEAPIYARYSNPNTDDFVNKVCILEGAETGFPTASGMAAVYLSMISFLKSGDHVLCSRAVFGSTHQILTSIFPRFGITFDYVSCTDANEWVEKKRANTKLFFVETPSNPGLQLVDLEAAGNFARDNDLLLIVDNCFATSVIQQPLSYGAHLIVHSATKFIDGQGKAMGGVVVGAQNLIDEVVFFARHTGPSMSPFNAWLLSKSIETIELRVTKHCQNAQYLAEALDGVDGLENVMYPFLPSHPQYALAKKQMKYGGGLISLDLGSTDRAIKFINNTSIPSITANLGDNRTIITHPSSTTHSKLSVADREAMGITDGMVRISVGLEDAEDLLEDIIQAIRDV